jgi:hypothetical protein
MSHSAELGVLNLKNLKHEFSFCKNFCSHIFLPLTFVKRSSLQNMIHWFKFNSAAWTILYYYIKKF